MANKEVKYYNGTKKIWNEELIRIVDELFDSPYNRYCSPCDEEIEYFIDTEWNRSEAMSESAIRQLFKKDYTDNKDIKKVYVKVTVLNDTYSTRLSNEDKVKLSEILVKHASEISGSKYDPKIVNTLCQEAKPIIGQEPYSFISKYCSHENEELYPIFDSYVELMLKWYRKKDKKKEFDFNDTELTKRDYDTFRKIILEFKKAFEISKSLKEIDEFLWTAGKRFFPSYIDEKLIP